jgi:hypothetical protein
MLPRFHRFQKPELKPTLLGTVKNKDKAVFPHRVNKLIE